MFLPGGSFAPSSKNLVGVWNNVQGTSKELEGVWEGRGKFKRDEKSQGAV